MSVRQATHAGSWYSNNASTLSNQLKELFANASQDVVKGARILVGPHAGYSYSGERLAETFKVWDTSVVKRVFILGPSHHVYFKNKALLSAFDAYHTPLGDVPVDTDTTKALIKSNKYFQYMSEEVDEDEHSFEMHAPFIYYATKDLPQGVPQIIPILISAADAQCKASIVEALSPYIGNPENHFVISSDFCHWGSRFGYTKYSKDPEDPVGSLIDLAYGTGPSSSFPLYKSIEALDRLALKVASGGSSKQWDKYISQTGNTICGQKPISLVLALIEHHQRASNTDSEVFRWIGYSQSNRAVSPRDSSVSYASGYVVLR